MKLLLKRVRVDDSFQQPTGVANHVTLHLSRPIILRPWCSALALTNVALAVPPSTLGILYPFTELVHKYGLYVPTLVISQDDREEIVVPIRNLTDHSISLKSGTELLELVLATGQKMELELVSRLPLY